MPPEKDEVTESKIQQEDRRPKDEERGRDYRQKKDIEQPPRDRDPREKR